MRYVQMARPDDSANPSSQFEKQNGKFSVTVSMIDRQWPFSHLISSVCVTLQDNLSCQTTGRK